MHPDDKFRMRVSTNIVTELLSKGLLMRSKYFFHLPWKIYQTAESHLCVIVTQPYVGGTALKNSGFPHIRHYRISTSPDILIVPEGEVKTQDVEEQVVFGQM